MKRALTIIIVAVNLTLVLGWVTFEWLVESEVPDPAQAAIEQVPAPEASLSAGTTTDDENTPPSNETGQAESEHPEGGALSERFDWRRPRERETRTTTPAPSKPRPLNREERKIDATTPPLANEPSRRPNDRGSRAEPRESEAVRPPSDRKPQEPETDDPVPDKPRDPSEDTEPPVLEWIRFTPEEIVAGSEVLLAASAGDDLAGVRDVVGRLSSPSGNAHVGFALPRNEETNVWQSAVRVPEKAEAGRWQITWLRITDTANNSRDHRWTPSSGPPGSSLIVRSPEGDGEPPVLQSVTLDRPTMAAGESIQIEVQVTDEPSGVRFVSGTFQSPSGKAWAPFTATGEGSFWTGAVTVPDDSECGEWKLRRITAIDNANNQATWGAGDERIAAVAFYRSFSGSCDSEPPVVGRIEISPRTVSNENNSTIQITAIIDDLGSGVSNASGFAMAAEPVNASPQRVHFVLQKSGEGPGTAWSGTLQIPRHSMAGRWEIRALRVADEARNQKTYGPADPVMADAWFVVE